MTENNEAVVVKCLFIIFSSLGFLSSLAILFLIKVMNKWNGYLALIWYETLLILLFYFLNNIFRSVEFCQLFYDASFSLYNIPYRKIHSVWTGIQFFGGLSSSIWTNILSFVVLYVVFKMSSFDILGHYYLFSFLALAPALLILILHLVYVGNEAAEVNIFNVYYYLRFLSIIFNFGTFAVIWHRARLIKSKSPSNKSPVEVAINVLSLRMIYYPFMQAVTVLPAAVYEKLYGIHQTDPTSSAQFAFDCVFAIVAPSTGIGYLIIFLVMQPNAYKHLCVLLSTCSRYRQEDSTVSAGTSSTTTSNSSRAGKSTIVSTMSAATDTNSHYHYNNGAGVPVYRADSTVLLHDRMQLMEDDELISEIDNSSTTGSHTGLRDSGASTGGTSGTPGRIFGSPFWKHSSRTDDELNDL